MHEFILNLIQIGAYIQPDDDAVLIDATGLLDTITEKRMAEAIRERGDAKFTEGMTQLHEIHFANLVVDSGAVRRLKTIACILTNPRYPIQPIVLALRENMNCSADDYTALFVEYFSSLEGLPL
jgi:hypothetical protein